MRGNPLTAVAAAGVFLLMLIAIFGPWIVPYDPIVSNVSQALMPPSAAHIAGTDQLGRDVFSRLIVAARLDLAIAVSAVGSPLPSAPSSARSAVIPVAGSIAASAASSTS